MSKADSKFVEALGFIFAMVYGVGGTLLMGYVVLHFIVKFW